MSDKYTILIKKYNSHFVALCLKLNVAAQGDSLLEARRELGSAISEYLSFVRETEISTAQLDIETLREFLTEDIEHTFKGDIFLI